MTTRLIVRALTRSLSRPVVRTAVSGGVTIETFTFTSTLPSDFTVTRANDTATVTDTNGDLDQVLANTARFDHDSSGTETGLFIETTRENKCEAINFNMTSGDESEFTVTGTGATLSVVSDPSTLLADAGLDQVCTNGNVYQLSAGASNATATINGTVGNTNIHSASVWAASNVGFTAGQIDITGGNVGATTISGTSMVRYTVERETPDATSRQFRIQANATRTVYFVLFQLEEGALPSSEILLSSAASATRNQDDIVNESITSLIDKNEGAVLFKGKMENVAEADQGFFGLTDDDSASDVIGLRSLSTDGFLEGQFISAGVDTSTEKVGKPLIDDDYVCGIVWNSSHVKIIHSHGGVVWTDTSVTVPAVALNDLWLGRWKKFSGQSQNIHIKEIKLFKGAATVGDVFAEFSSEVGKVYPVLGQSNGAYISKNMTQSDYTNAGEVEAISQLDTFYSDRNGVCNMAIGGSALYSAENATNHWWADNTLAVKGDIFENALEALKAHTDTKLLNIEWDQGESNGSQSVADIKIGVKGIIDTIRSEVRSDIEMIISPLGRRSDNATGDALYRRHAQAFLELASENSYISLAPNKKVLPLFDETGATDAVHISDAGQEERVKWSVRKLADMDGETVSGAVDGSTISAASGAGTTTITVTISHPTGITDFTPTTGIEGFKYISDVGGSDTEITINSAVRTNATTITLTLASSGSNTQEVLYCTDTQFGVTVANLVRGNDSNTMPLQIAKVTVS